MKYKIFYIEFSTKGDLKYNVSFHTILIAANETEAKNKLKKDKYLDTKIVFLKVEEIGDMSTKQPIQNYGCFKIEF